jgi:hypothetical protein
MLAGLAADTRPLKLAPGPAGARVADTNPGACRSLPKITGPGNSAKGLYSLQVAPRMPGMKCLAPLATMARQCRRPAGTSGQGWRRVAESCYN